MSGLAFIETPFLSITAVVADAVLKNTGTRLLGFDTSGNEEIIMRLAGPIGALEAAVETARSVAERLGVKCLSASLARPHPDHAGLYDGANSISPLYGGRDQFLPTDYPNPPDTMNNDTPALGILETQGLTAILQATDAMLKAADVKLVGKEKIGAAYVTIIVKGDVAAVKAAIEAGTAAAAPLGKVIAAQVIARPHPELLALLPK